MELNQLEKQIGYEFYNKETLETALTHTSYAYEKKINSNEKLEFLGDSILEFISSEFIYQNYKNLTEGEMTKVRATVVCEESLYEIAKKYNLNNFLRLGKSEQISKSEVRPTIMADSVEAIIAAIFLDGGLEPAIDFIVNNLRDDIELATKHIGEKDYKTVLQEILQKDGRVNIEYKITNQTGPDHDKTFFSEVICNKKVLAKGSGKSKKMAEMDAAKIALQNFNS